MPKPFIESPQTLQGTSMEQLQSLYNYLVRMSEQLNEALNSITIEQMTPEAQKEVKAGAAAKQENTNTYKTLKSLIVKTAEIVQHEMDEISTTLEDNFRAVSEQFGELNRSLEGTIRATAEGILQDYRYSERIEGLEDASGNTQLFVRQTNQYIFSGLVDEVNVKYGIAIGENVTAVDGEGNPIVDENGNTVLNHANKMATFTMDRMSFFQGGIEVAYFSNHMLYIEQAQILSQLQIGAHHAWQVMANGSISLINI